MCRKRRASRPPIDRDQAAFNKACIGHIYPVLFEKAGRMPGQIVGRSPYLQPVHVIGSQDLIGEITDVRVHALERYSLFGEPCRPIAGKAHDAAMLATAGA